MKEIGIRTCSCKGPKRGAKWRSTLPRISWLERDIDHRPSPRKVPSACFVSWFSATGVTFCRILPGTRMFELDPPSRRGCFIWLYYAKLRATRSEISYRQTMAVLIGSTDSLVSFAFLRFGVLKTLKPWNSKWKWDTFYGSWKSLQGRKGWDMWRTGRCCSIFLLERSLNI